MQISIPWAVDQEGLGASVTMFLLTIQGAPDGEHMVPLGPRLTLMCKHLQ